jgi:hypothetical protein
LLHRQFALLLPLQGKMLSALLLLQLNSMQLCHLLWVLGCSFRSSTAAYCVRHLCKAHGC